MPGNRLDGFVISGLEYDERAASLDAQIDRNHPIAKAVAVNAAFSRTAKRFEHGAVKLPLGIVGTYRRTAGGLPPDTLEATIVFHGRADFFGACQDFQACRDPILHQLGTLPLHIVA